MSLTNAMQKPIEFGDKDHIQHGIEIIGLPIEIIIFAISICRFIAYVLQGSNLFGIDLQIAVQGPDNKQ